MIVDIVSFMHQTFNLLKDCNQKIKTRGDFKYYDRREILIELRGDVYEKRNEESLLRAYAILSNKGIYLKK